MKRFFAVAVIALSLLCLLSFTVSAAPAAVLSEDLQTMTCYGQTYSRADISLLDLYLEDYTHIELQVPQALSEDLKTYKVAHDEAFSIISVKLYYQDGSVLTVPFVADLYSDLLWQLHHDDNLEADVNNYWNDYQEITAVIGDLKGEPVYLDSDQLQEGDLLEVCVRSEELNCVVNRGAVCVRYQQVYYVDYLENNIVDTSAYTALENPDLRGYQVTDPTLRQEILDAVRNKNSYINEDDQVELSLSAIFLCFVFAIIPTVIFIFSTIIAIRSKGYYKLTWGITAGLCIAELGVFLIIVSQILLA